MSKTNLASSKRIIRRREYLGSVFLKHGIRPFFLGAALWSAIVMMLWVATLEGFIELPTRISPTYWHIHEMLFGFVTAAISGFLLTTVPNWTGRLPVCGWPLAGLFGLWVAGRFHLLFSDWLPDSVVITGIIIDTSFLCVISGLLMNEIIAGKNWRNLKTISLVVGLAVCHLLFYNFLIDDLFDWQPVIIFNSIDENSINRLAIMMVVILITVVGRRITYNLTNSWISNTSPTKVQKPVPWGRIDFWAMVTTVFAALLYSIDNGAVLTGIVCILASLILGLQLSRWRGHLTLAEPLIVILHIGYGWISFSFLLVGIAALSDFLPVTSAFHAFTAGVIGVILLAIMTRASRRYTGTPLTADKKTVAIYILVNLSAFIRIFGTAGEWTHYSYLASGILWITAFILFLLFYTPMLFSH